VALRYDTISLLTDYGTSDEFVGVVKSVIRSIAPQVTVIDITHDIEPHDVRAGGLALARAAQYLVPGVVLAVVDPGVGTERKPVAIEVGGGQSVLVGPDNGLLAPAVAMVGGATRAVVLDDTEYHLPAPGPTFDGRDVFAPVAAQLCAGVPLEAMGSLIDPHLLRPGVLPVAGPDKDGSYAAEVLWIDRFGNAQLNVDPDEVEGLGEVLTLRTRDGSRTAQRVRSFADIPTGGIGLVVDSYGLLALAVDRASAAAELGLHEGDAVNLVALGEGVRRSTTSAVELTAKPSRRRPDEELP
jgi:S-adenosyl-L-methionine hydrolase (adenosine-forming)